ncbi:MAG: carbon starvation protein A [Isosphaeraceae bacterium]
MTLTAMPVLLVALLVLAIAFGFYGRFLARRVAGLDPDRVTPAHTKFDGQNFDPTNRWVLFGHHFGAISGAGPLIGPVLAIQFGYAPGLIWLLAGVCLAGAVQDMMVLFVSVRRGGLSLASIAREELGPIAGGATALAILYVIVVALAGLGIVVVKALGGEQVRMDAGTCIVCPVGQSPTLIDEGKSGGLAVYEIPERSTYRYGQEPGQEMLFHESYRLAFPAQGEGAVIEQKGGPVEMILPRDSRRLVPGSSWGTFTIACTIPIALLIGLYMYRIRKGKVLEASLLGASLVLGATVYGARIPGSWLEPLFSMSRETTILSLAIYGFVAAVLPVWLLLCPRDYLSSFLKIGTIGLLVVGVCAANPVLHAPAFNEHFAGGGGPNMPGPIFPYLFICIMCGAISGFHSLVSSGTTPKMIDNERDIRMIGYGAMLIEGLVGIVALIAAAALPNAMYYDINVALDKRPGFEKQLAAMGIDHADEHAGDLANLEKEVGESLHGRTGGAVTLAVGMARILTEALPRAEGIIKYWYHFAIMFEALFILTTIDAGTRIGRFLVQEFLGRLWKPLGDFDWLPASLLSTGLVVFGWAYFIYSNSIDTIWPMFGLANQLLALIALTVVTTYLFNQGKGRYAWVTLGPMLFVSMTTSTAAFHEIAYKYLGWIRKGDVLKGSLNIALTGFLVTCVAVIVVTAVRRWIRVTREAASTPQSANA